MGGQSSPYNSIRTFLWGEDIVKGDRRAINNPLRWDTVVTNLPGSRNYDPRRPWLYRFDAINNKIADNLVLMWMILG